MLGNMKTSITKITPWHFELTLSRFRTVLIFGYVWFKNLNTIQNKKTGIARLSRARFQIVVWAFDQIQLVNIWHSHPIVLILHARFLAVFLSIEMKVFFVQCPSQWNASRPEEIVKPLQCQSFLILKDPFYGGVSYTETVIRSHIAWLNRIDIRQLCVPNGIQFDRINCNRWTNCGP